MDPHGRVLSILDRSRYYFFQVAPQLERDVYNLEDMLSLYGLENIRHAKSSAGTRNVFSERFSVPFTAPFE
jgi:hypothetical protein